MKKLYSQARFQRYNTARSRRAEKQNAEFKHHQKLHNASQIGIKEVKVNRRSLRATQYPQHRPPVPSFAERFKDYVPVTAPSDFRFLENAEEVIDFISELGVCFDHQLKVLLRLDDINRIDYSAIAVLYSIMVRFKAKKIPFAGTTPKSPYCNDILGRSGFFISMDRQFADRDRYIIQKGDHVAIYADRSVEAERLGELLDEAALTIWGAPRRCPEVQTNLIELAQNTEEHAALLTEERKHGWLSVNHDPRRKTVSFSWVDFGVGIFESLDQKPADNKFYGAGEKLYEKFKYGNNAELLKLILKGELHKTVTGAYNRGQGLPGLLDSLDEGWMRRLFVISNDAFADVTEDDFRKLHRSFTGTFVYWELTKDCRTLDPVT